MLQRKVPTVFPSTVHWEKVATGLGLSQSWWGGGRKLWCAGSGLGYPVLYHQLSFSVLTQV